MAIPLCALWNTVYFSLTTQGQYAIMLSIMIHTLYCIVLQFIFLVEVRNAPSPVNAERRSFVD